MKEKLMMFEGKNVEVLEVGGKILFNPKHVAECLDIKDVNSSMRTFNEKQVIKLKNSDMHDMHNRKLNNTGEKFLTESGVYKLIFKSHKPEAEKFQDWVTDEVIPSIRETGGYINPQANNQQLEMNNYIVGLARSIQLSNQAISGILVTMNNMQEFVKDSINAKDHQLDQARELMGIRDRNTKMLTQTLKDKLSDLTGENIYATNPIYIRNKIKVFREFKVFSWESIPIGEFNKVHAYIDSLEEAM